MLGCLEASVVHISNHIGCCSCTCTNGAWELVILLLLLHSYKLGFHCSCTVGLIADVYGSSFVLIKQKSLIKPDGELLILSTCHKTVHVYQNCLGYSSEHVCDSVNNHYNYTETTQKTPKNTKIHL